MSSSPNIAVLPCKHTWKACLVFGERKGKSYVTGTINVTLTNVETGQSLVLREPYLSEFVPNLETGEAVITQSGAILITRCGCRHDLRGRRTYDHEDRFRSGNRRADLVRNTFSKRPA